MKWLIVGCALILTAVTGCDQIQQIVGPGPEKVVAAYLENQKSGNWELAHSLLSSTDRATQPVSEYVSAARENPFLPGLLSKTTYKILSVEKKGDRAAVQLEMSSPDLAAAMAEVMSNALTAAFASQKLDNIQKQAAEKLERGGYPMKTYNEKFTLVRESEGWRVFLDLATKKQITALSADAEKMRKRNQFAQASEKYDAILKLDAKDANAIKAKEELTREIAANAEKMEYFDKIELYDLAAKYYSTFLDGRMPGVEFKLRNKGAKTLNRVQVTVYFTDQGGAVIAEKEYSPVLVNQFSRDPPLRPNYIWQLERGKFLTAKSVPTEWKEGAVKAKITDVEFDK